MCFKKLNHKSYLFFFILYFASLDVFALAFTPSENEWATWGAMCRARYVVSGAGSTNEFKFRIPTSEVELWKNKLGHAAWNGLHHYCAGLIFENKRSDPARAIKEYLYTLNGIPTKDRYFTIISARIANASYTLGKNEQALKFANNIISANPNGPTGYVVKGMIERKEGLLARAIETLEFGYEKTQGASAELNYHLGISYYGAGNFENARKYADLAYKLGYPLPWLKDELKAKGMWN